MNKQQLESILHESPETTVRVSERLHQDVMRKIRLSQPVRKKAGIPWSVPAWGAALAVCTIAIISATQTNTPVQSESTAPQLAFEPGTLLDLSDQLLTVTEESLLPEKELKLEFERLKQDLKRFDIRS